jgi:2-(1,2-epoxy-1,2-dihydrophenyl)acetyl-CoA isomerase
MLTNRVLSAGEALEWGVINQVVSEDALEEEVSKLASKFAAGPTLAFGQVKSLLNASFDNGLETQMELETRGISDMSKTDDGKEGIQAFLAKRKPEFKKTQYRQLFRIFMIPAPAQFIRQSPAPAAHRCSRR